MSEGYTLWHVLKKTSVKTNQEIYGVFCVHTGGFPNPAVCVAGAPQSSLEELAKTTTEVATKHGSWTPGFVFERQESFPVSAIEGKEVFTYSELSQQEREKFLFYLQRALSGEPAKKRHNPEITQEDLEQAMREQNGDEN